MMNKYADQLLLKVKSVLHDYQFKVKLGQESLEMDSEQSKIFESMKRWHANSHMSESDWKVCFDKIKHKVDVKENMKNLDDDLRKFLKTKFAAENPQDQFAISPILEFLESDIRDFYRMKTGERDDKKEDEYSLNSIAQGMDPDDLNHYGKVFLPAALFFTYLEKYPCTNRSVLMSDCFTIGHGSQTYDLFQEVTALCTMCATGEEYENFNEADIEKYNKKIFKMQFKDGFESSYVMSNSDDSDKSDNSDKNGRNMDHVGTWYNPFDSSSPSEGSDDEDIILTGYECNQCSKSFTRKDFLNFHTECFHKTSLKSNYVQFVADPEDLISSFTQEPETSYNFPTESGSQAKHAKTTKTKTKITTEVKLGTRRSLRFNKT